MCWGIRRHADWVASKMVIQPIIVEFVFHLAVGAAQLHNLNVHIRAYTCDPSGT